MNKKILTILFLLLMPLFAFSQLTKGLKGKVVDREGKPVRDVTITIVDKSNSQNRYEIKTDKDGVYLYAGLPFSSEGYLVSVKVGDLPEVQKIIKVKMLEMVELDFDMRKDLIMQETKEVVANPAADAQELFKAEDYQGAIEKADEYLKGEDKKNEKVVLLIKARSLGKLNRTDEELDTYLKYLELYPNSDMEKEAVGRVADLYQKKGDKANSEKYKKKFKELGGTIVAENYNKGVEKLNEGDAKGAIEYFKLAFVDDPNDPDAHRELARAYAQVGDYAGAVEQLKIYLKMKPNADDAEQWKQAIKALEPMIKK
ncbi:MAG: tetratricopeptide repeat protein [Acidobacteria bacterium]|nr:tetratricopeptide repeat protein [Acidobacteriota bacterium]